MNYLMKYLAVINSLILIAMGARLVFIKYKRKNNLLELNRILREEEKIKSNKVINLGLTIFSWYIIYCGIKNILGIYLLIIFLLLVLYSLQKDEKINLFTTISWVIALNYTAIKLCFYLFRPA